MNKPKIYDKYLQWCNGDDMPNSFDNTPVKDIQECMKYERYLKSKKGRVIPLHHAKKD